MNLKDLDGRMFVRYPSDPYQKFRDHFQAGDKIYGLSLNRLEYIDIAHKKVGRDYNLTIDQLNKNFLGVKLLAGVGLDYYEKGILLGRSSEESDFKNYLEAHSTYNPLKVPGIEEETRMREAFIRVGRACKAGIEFTIEKKHRKVHFVLDGIDQASIPQKISHHQLPIRARSPEFIEGERCAKELI